MPIPEELRAPISEEQPAGEDLSGSDEHAEVERLFRSVNEPARMGPGGAASESDVTFAEVAERAKGYLEQSKNLKIGALLTVALLHHEGIESMADGLELLRQWLERYWDSVHPVTGSRLAVLSWLGSDDVAVGLNLVPMTAAYGSGLVPMTAPGHRLAEYRLWLAAETGGGTLPTGVTAEAAEAIAAGFSRGFAESSRRWYRAQQTALTRCDTAWRALDVLVNARYDQKIRQKWGYVSQYEKAGAGDARGAFAKGLKALESPIRDLVARKPPEPGEQPEATAAPVSEEGSVTEAESGSAPGAWDPETPDEATRVLRSAIRVLRRAEPTNPAAYLMVRGWRWGELRAEGETIGPRLLEAPATTERVRLKSLHLDQNWSELLDEVEERMATPVGRGWLDLQRYAIVAATKLGPEYRYVVAGLEGALTSLLADFPQLAKASMMDDLPTTSPDTLLWFESRGFIRAGVGAGAGAAAADIDPGDSVREATYSRAAQMAQAGDTEGAIGALLERAKREGSQRARFLTKAQAAGIMVAHGLTPVARHILDELDNLITSHRLDEWESSEIVTQPLSLMIRCLAPGDPNRAAFQERLARLDPLLAMRVANEPSLAEPADG